jgi:hypothetical protein
MDRRLTFPLVAATVAAVGSLCAWALLAPALLAPAPAPPQPLPIREARSPPAIVAHCKRAAELLYDVHWAAACFKSGTDDSNDCTLPDAQAAQVNSILDTEAARCLAAEAQARAAP